MLRLRLLARPRVLPLAALLPWIIAVSVIGLALFVGYRIGRNGLNYQDLVLMAMGVAAGVIVLHRRGLEIGFVLWVGLFILGYRMTRLNVPLALDRLLNGGPVSPKVTSMGATPEISLHPLVIVIVVLFVIRVIRQVVSRERIPAWRLPRALWVFSLFWVWGWAQGSANGFPWPKMFPEILHFVMMFPVFIVSAAALTDRRYWRPVVAVLYFAGTFIAFFGLLEYAVPGVRHLIPGFVTAAPDMELVTITQDGFIRATFSFWGTNAAATFICIMALPMAFPLWMGANRSSVRLLILVAGIVQLLGIYIGGYRSIWMTLAVIVTVTLFLRFGVRGLLVAAVALFLILNLLPEAALGRLETGLAAATGNFEDSSSLKRWNRVNDAFEDALRHPFGKGWTAAGWAHSDFVQVLTNLGILAGALFAGWYGITLLSAWRAMRAYPQDTLIVALVCSFFGTGALYLFEGVSVYPQLALPAWLIWALTDLRVQQLRHEHPRQERVREVIPA